ncbi:MAG: hypothetical protein JO370_13495 [Paucibacter sp.]|nr:hypothetical protein [Roseateles sp.]
MNAKTLQLDWRAAALASELALRRWGLMRVLALGMLAGGTMALAAQMAYSFSRPERDLQDQLTVRRNALRQAMTVDPKAAQTSTGLDPLLSLLGEGDRVEQYVKEVFATAHESGIDLGAGEYRWAREAHAETDRYQVRLPVKGSYASIRGFCEQVLVKLPFASLDDFSLKRESIGDAEVEAQLQFSFHLHASAAGQAGTKEGHS